MVDPAKYRPWQIVALLCVHSFFFFQAEDGIRDLTVTGVQTCALPISKRTGAVMCSVQCAAPGAASTRAPVTVEKNGSAGAAGATFARSGASASAASRKIGRASCRERV